MWGGGRKKEQWFLCRGSVQHCGSPERVLLCSSPSPSHLGVGLMALDLHFLLLLLVTDE